MDPYSNFNRPILKLEGLLIPNALTPPLLQSVLRILDCFLFEGMKVLFRMTLGILRVNERRVLNLTDPVALFQFLKEVARHTFDMEAVFSVSLSRLCPYYSRSGS